MRIRDRAAVVVLAASVLLAALAWRPLGAWISLVVLVVGVLAAATAYRLEPPALLPLEERAATTRMTATAVAATAETDRPSWTRAVQDDG